MSDCIFCKIAAGEIPSAKVYEDATKLAFMDIGPIQPGHTLLILKAHHECLTDLPPAALANLVSVLPKLAAAVVRATNADGFNIHQTNGACSGQSVPHVHIHIIPRHDNDGYHFNWRPSPYKAGEIEKWQTSIRAELGKA